MYLNGDYNLQIWDDDDSQDNLINYKSSLDLSEDEENLIERNTNFRNDIFNNCQNQEINVELISKDKNNRYIKEDFKMKNFKNNLFFSKTNDETFNFLKAENHINNNSINKKLLNKKRKSSDKEENTENTYKGSFGNINNKKICPKGRKKKDEEEERKHNKYSQDNIIIKLKGYFVNFIINLIEQNSINEIVEFKKLPNKFTSDLKKEKNEKLHIKKLADIFKEEKISGKYLTLDEYENKKIVQKIFEENEEIKIIKILELTYEEAFILFRRTINYENDKDKIKEIFKKFDGLDILDNNKKYKDINYYIQEIREKYEDEEYIKNVKYLCCNYGKWFSNKVGRKSK